MGNPPDNPAHAQGRTIFSVSRQIPKNLSAPHPPLIHQPLHPARARKDDSEDRRHRQAHFSPHRPNPGKGRTPGTPAHHSDEYL